MNKLLTNRAIWGALLGLLTVVLLYAKLADLATDTVQAYERNTKAHEAKKQADKVAADSAIILEKKWRADIVSALREHGKAPITTGSAGGKANLNPANTGAGGSPASDTSGNVTPTTMSSGARPGSAAPRPAGGGNSGTTVAPTPRNVPPPTDAIPTIAPVYLWSGGGVLVLLMLLLGWQVWQERRRPLKKPNPNAVDSDELQKLLTAFALEIGRVLDTPRRIKRFSSKARLQHNLLQAYADTTAQQAAKDTTVTPFRFDLLEMGLAFALLLLIEEESAREEAVLLKRPANDTSPLPERLRDQDEAAFGIKLRELYKSWLGTAAAEKLSTRLTRSYLYELPAVVGDDPNSGRLLIQLHRLNAGMLV